MAPFLTSTPVDAMKAREALHVAPKVVKVVAQPPPKLQVAKPPMTSASAKSSTAPQQSTSQVQPLTKHSSSTGKQFSGQLQPFQGSYSISRRRLPPPGNVLLKVIP